MTFRSVAVAVFSIVALAGSGSASELNVSEPRRSWRLDGGWRTVADEFSKSKFDGFEGPGFDDSDWKPVEVPHNWDDYGGARRLVHGNFHGYAWYRRQFDVPREEKGRRVFLFFEGVGSYATVWVNGQRAGVHAGGRTTFTLDVTELIHFDASNVLAVRADHPAGITDLPWVCGGCAATPGFSEGSQPLGIFRPVHLVTTHNVRVEPFGVHVWNDADATADKSTIHVTTELRRYAGSARDVRITSRVLGAGRRPVAENRTSLAIADGVTVARQDLALSRVRLWALEDPFLYTMLTEVEIDGRVVDRVETFFGIRTVQWPDPAAPEPSPFRLNGKPVFINGTCEYEHLLGNSHAFADEQIRARTLGMKSAGFNAFRDAHQPHNLRYQEFWDANGMLWWTQMAAQIWYDNPPFRENFKTLLREWVRERRNSPSLVLWGLANESKLPTAFAAECTAIIRELDPTSPSQRLVTTCNGGTGTDWNVPQNWTGTYGGNPAEYAEDLKRQRLIGEYGAWRSLGLHSEGGFIMDGIRSESRADALFAMKIRLAETVRDIVPGHFHWLFATHDNPGRTIGSRGQQGSDGWEELDRIGPANNKGLQTLWGEPTDAYYLYRASYAPKSDPMVYIVSHTWPERWSGPGLKQGIQVYSNCDEVELFNDVGSRSLGIRRQGGPGVPFQWDDVEIATGILYAEGRVAGKVVARDTVQFRNLPAPAGISRLIGREAVSTAAARGWNYLYRVNCGGEDFKDSHGQLWYADRDLRPGDTWGSSSWAQEYDNVPARFGSQRAFFEPVKGTREQDLFHTFRYGRHELRYEFAVPDGEYRVEMYFVEPWYGRGGGDSAGWRLFDVAVNGESKLRDVDLWKEAGYAAAVRKVVTAKSRDGRIVISFPKVKSNQAVISAIAIAAKDPQARAPVAQQTSEPRASRSEVAHLAQETETTGRIYAAQSAEAKGSELIWRVSLGLGGSHDFAIRYVNRGAEVDAEFRVNAADGSVLEHRTLRLPASDLTPLEARIRDVGMNAGDYTVTLLIPGQGEKTLNRPVVEHLRVD